MADTTLSTEQVSGTEQPGAAAADPQTAQTPEAPAGDPKDEGFDSLPEHWQREVRSLRDENAERRTKYNEVKGLLDQAKSPEEFAQAVDEYRSQISELERKLALAEHTAGLPPEAVELVTGTTDEEIKASASRVRNLLEAVGKTPESEQKRRDPDPEATGGVDPRASRSATGGLNPQELARAALGRR